MLSTTGIEENRIPLSMRSKLGRGGCSTFGLCAGFARGLLLPLGAAVVEAEDPAARAAAAAAAAAEEDDFEVVRWEEVEVEWWWCLETPPLLETEGLRGEGFVPGGRGRFLGGAIFFFKQISSKLQELD